jgi:hypothetical protein
MWPSKLMTANTINALQLYRLWGWICGKAEAVLPEKGARFTSMMTIIIFSSCILEHWTSGLRGMLAAGKPPPDGITPRL